MCSRTSTRLPSVSNLSAAASSDSGVSRWRPATRCASALASALALRESNMTPVSMSAPSAAAGRRTAAAVMPTPPRVSGSSIESTSSAPSTPSFSLLRSMPIAAHMTFFISSSKPSASVCGVGPARPSAPADIGTPRIANTAVSPTTFDRYCATCRGSSSTLRASCALAVAFEYTLRTAAARMSIGPLTGKPSTMPHSASPSTTRLKRPSRSTTGCSSRMTCSTCAPLTVTASAVVVMPNSSNTGSRQSVIHFACLLTLPLSTVW
mmetsp:Transcript_2777/g.6494  ORF Transcript_2777/g.6494 Transcript_2777/m.6494 type:complete len:265 (-) Transcript_2777:665-1459(-)